MDRRALIFDIETIADLTPENRAAVSSLAQDRQLAPEEYGALCPPLARVVCIGWFDVAAQQLGVLFDATLGAGEWPGSLAVDTVENHTRMCEVCGCAGEADLLRQFGRRVTQHLAQPNAQLVTFNGRGFDLPVLIHRTIKHGVAEGRELFVKAVNENRYRPLLHADLMDAVTFFGASGRWPLAAYAVGYGWRSPKQDMKGAQVSAAVGDGRILDVVRYCAGDVLATAHVHRCLSGGLPAPPDSTPSA